MRMSKPPANGLAHCIPTHNGPICNRGVSTAGRCCHCYTWSIMVLLVLMLWNGGGAPGASAARAHLGSGNQLLQAERFVEAADEFQQALHDDPALAQAREQLAVCYLELRAYSLARS